MRLLQLLIILKGRIYKDRTKLARDNLCIASYSSNLEASPPQLQNWDLKPHYSYSFQRNFFFFRENICTIRLESKGIIEMFMLY